MSMTLMIAARDRLAAELARAGSPLHDWADANAPVHLELGYRRPATADGWPFLALEATRDRRDLRSGKGDVAQIALVAGYMLADQSRSQAAGILAVDALAEAALAALALPWMSEWAGRRWDARTAERVDMVSRHPNYELEIAVAFGRVGLNN